MKVNEEDSSGGVDWPLCVPPTVERDRRAWSTYPQSSVSGTSRLIYRVNLKMSQDENYDISEIREYFCTKFCSFVYKTTVQKCAALCCIHLTFAKLTETQTSGTNFATVQIVCTKG